MKTRRRLTLGFFVATMMALGAGPAQAVTSAGPYYAEPSWDQKLQCDTQATCPRFIVLSNWSSAAVLDRETGLVWEQSPDGTNTYTWSAARGFCANKNVGGRKGWRLPSFAELAGLVDPNNVDTVPPNFETPALPPGHPFTTVQPSFYWSATAYDPAFAWVVFFGNGDVGIGGKTVTDFVWCVRGGMNADQY